MDNAIADAKLIAETLSGLGFRFVSRSAGANYFEVVDTASVIEDATHKELESACLYFADEAKQSSFAVGYYAGHGVVVEGVEYFRAVDIAKGTISTKKYSTNILLVRQDALIRAASEVKHSLVLLDMCRELVDINRGGSWQSRAERMPVLENQIVAYAALKGELAADSAKRLSLSHGPFALGIAGNLSFPNTPIPVLLQNAQTDAAYFSNQLQVSEIVNRIAVELPVLRQQAPPAHRRKIAICAQDHGDYSARRLVRLLLAYGHDAYLIDVADATNFHSDKLLSTDLVIFSPSSQSELLAYAAQAKQDFIITFDAAKPNERPDSFDLSNWLIGASDKRIPDLLQQIEERAASRDQSRLESAIHAEKEAPGMEARAFYRKHNLDETEDEALIDDWLRLYGRFAPDLALTAQEHLAHVRSAKAERHAAAWRLAEQEDTVVAYAKFLEEFPVSEHRSTASLQIQRLQADEAEWRAAEEGKDIEAIKEYLKRDRPKFLDVAQGLLATIQDESIWKAATKINTVDAYEEYLGSAGKQAFASEAKSAIRNLKAAIILDAALKEGTIAALNAIVADVKGSTVEKQHKDALERLQDDAAADELVKEKNVHSLEKYVLQRPRRRNYNKVKAVLDKERETQRYKETIKAKTIAAYEAFLRDYPSSVHADEIKELRKIEIQKNSAASLIAGRDVAGLVSLLESVSDDATRAFIAGEIARLKKTGRRVFAVGIILICIFILGVGRIYSLASSLLSSEESVPDRSSEPPRSPTTRQPTPEHGRAIEIAEAATNYTGDLERQLQAAASMKELIDIREKAPHLDNSFDARSVQLGFYRIEIKGQGLLTELYRRFDNPRPFQDCSFCPQMIVVPPGMFWMGSNLSERGRLPNESHGSGGLRAQVKVPRPIALGQSEVTITEYRNFVKQSKHREPSCDVGSVHNEAGPGIERSTDWWDTNSDRPAVCVSYEDSVAYARWLSSVSGAKYRLLSEAEWEYAARGGTETPHWPGATELELQAKGIRYSSGEKNKEVNGPIGAREGAANSFGLVNTIGNVWEWVQDCYLDSYEFRPEAFWNKAEPRVETCPGEPRVIRGGAFLSRQDRVRSAAREGAKAESRLRTIGFRVARELP